MHQHTFFNKIIDLSVKVTLGQKNLALCKYLNTDWQNSIIFLDGSSNLHHICRAPKVVFLSWKLSPNTPSIITNPCNLYVYMYVCICMYSDLLCNTLYLFTYVFLFLVQAVVVWCFWSVCFVAPHLLFLWSTFILFRNVHKCINIISYLTQVKTSKKQLILFLIIISPTLK